jgi:hypothetical protein
VTAARVGVVVLVVLVTRALAYAFVPEPRAALLAGRVGGPALPVVGVSVLAIALALASAIVFLASLAVRERLRLERRPVAAPLLRVRRVLLHATALFALALPVSTALEAYLHWRSGLGWHGLSCFTGPVHRDLAPLTAAVSVVAAAAWAAVAHVLAWMRRLVSAFAAAPRVGAMRPSVASVRALPVPRRAVVGPQNARGPPLFSS